MPAQLDLPFSRFSVHEIRAHVLEKRIVESIGATTIWEWLHRAGIRPWTHRPWIFPRDPDFEQKAARVLDLYARLWEGKRLADGDLVISADEKTSIQARHRIHERTPPAPGQASRVEHGYKRTGAVAYLAAYDVHRADVFGICETRTGAKAFQKLVDHVMKREPYRSAKRVFWIVDNGTSHRGLAACERLRHRWRNLTLVHTPIHASWLNQIEIYFSIVQRKVLTPNDFSSVAQLKSTILSFQQRYSSIATPFAWRFSREDLHRLLSKLAVEPLVA